MSLSLVLGAALLLALYVALRGARRRDQPGLKRRQANRRQRNGHSGFAYRAVSVHPASPCCKAVRGLRKQRFLTNDPPLLPLPDCDLARCRCQYRHHEDRRHSDERRILQSVDNILTGPHDGPEYRNNRGRRRLDYA